MNIDQQTIQKLRSLAAQYSIQKMTLFGSRARGTNHEHSDIDLAVWGIRDAAGYFDFQEAVEEQVFTLLQFDIVDMGSSSVSDALRAEIERDGVVLYEKI